MEISIYDKDTLKIIFNYYEFTPNLIKNLNCKNDKLVLINNTNNNDIFNESKEYINKLINDIIYKIDNIFYL